jgi:hypothetical protein
MSEEDGHCTGDGVTFITTAVEAMDALRIESAATVAISSRHCTLSWQEADVMPCAGSLPRAHAMAGQQLHRASFWESSNVRHKVAQPHLRCA